MSGNPAESFQKAVADYSADRNDSNLEFIAGVLLARMSLREKTRLLTGRWIPFIRQVLRNFLVPSGSMFDLPFLGSGCRRLGVPHLSFSDGGKGLTGKRFTCFPVSLARAASFDPDLESEVGRVFAVEGIIKGINAFGGICTNLVRNPRWGRSQESYGEDPYLSGRMAVSVIEEVQSRGIIAMPKHFALNSIESLRFLISAEADERTIHEVYLSHFKKCVDAGAWSIMSAYNRVNGIYCGENGYLLNDVLRKQWKFAGMVCSDYIWGIHDTAESLNAGCDLEMPIPIHHTYRAIKRSIASGRLQVGTVEKSTSRVLKSLIRAYSSRRQYDSSLRKCELHYELAERAALEGMTLLKNDGILPLDRKISIAVVGPYADTVNVGDTGSSTVIARDTITPFAGLAEQFGRVSLSNSNSIEKALKAAEGTDCVIACIGFDRHDEGEMVVKGRPGRRGKRNRVPGGDRRSLTLKPRDVRLVRSLRAAGKRVVVVLSTGSIALTEEIEDYAEAIILAYYAGVRGGRALAKLICGEENFSGKLPVSIAKHETNYPKFHEIGETPYVREYGYYHGYTLFDRDKVDVRYPFGFGMSYTTFRLSDCDVLFDNGSIAVRCTAANTGTVKGAEVIQVYVGSLRRDRDRPTKTLKGFRRVVVEPGVSEHISIPIEVEDLRFYDPATRTWDLDDEYRVFVGNSSRDVIELDTRIKASWFQ